MIRIHMEEWVYMAEKRIEQDTGKRRLQISLSIRSANTFNNNNPK